jgi:hypothetical protein
MDKQEPNMQKSVQSYLAKSVQKYLTVTSLAVPLFGEAKAVTIKVTKIDNATDKYLLIHDASSSFGLRSMRNVLFRAKMTDACNKQ